MGSNDLGYLWSHEFFRRHLSLREHGSDLGSAEADVFFFIVGAGFLVCDSSTFFAVEEGFEEGGAMPRSGNSSKSSWACAQIREHFHQ